MHVHAEDQGSAAGAALFCRENSKTFKKKTRRKPTTTKANTKKFRRNFEEIRSFVYVLRSKLVTGTVLFMFTPMVKGLPHIQRCFCGENSKTLRRKCVECSKYTKRMRRFFFRGIIVAGTVVCQTMVDSVLRRELPPCICHPRLTRLRPIWPWHCCLCVCVRSGF